MDIGRTARRRSRLPPRPRGQGLPGRRPRAAGPRLHRPGLPRLATGRRRSCATSARSTTTAAWAAPGTCRSSRSTRASSTRRRRASPRTPTTSTRPTSSSWPWPESATPSPRPSAASGSSPGATPHRDPVHRQAQPQRLPALPEHLRPGACSPRSARRSTSARSASGRPSTSAPSSPTARSTRCREAFAEAHRLGLFTVLWCYLRNAAFKTGRRRLPRLGRPHRPGQPHGRHHRGRHHQAEAAREQRRLQRPQVRQDRPARLRRAHHRPPDRPHPLAGRQLLRRSDRPHQLRRRVQGRHATWPRRCAPPSSTSGPAARV